MKLKYLFEQEQKPRRGLLAAEWVVMGYLVATLLVVLFLWPRLENPEEMVLGRVCIAIATGAMWLVYRRWPCRLTHLARYVLQGAILSWWYPDTYELNRILPNLDHVFAGIDQQLFGLQPALVFSQMVSHPVFSELMHLGYASYYPLMAVVAVYYFCQRYDELDRAVFIILTSFFVYYVVFDLLPVTGPQYYYLAAGVENIAAGVLPDVGHYFATHQEALPMPGWSDGLCYHLVETAHAAGERPTAAFPSSHVGVTTILMLLAWRTHSRGLFWGMMPLYVLMCLATVYIQAHYAIDVVGGWISALAIYAILHFFAKKFA